MRLGAMTPASTGPRNLDGSGRSSDSEHNQRRHDLVGHRRTCPVPNQSRAKGSSSDGVPDGRGAASVTSSLWAPLRLPSLCRKRIAREHRGAALPVRVATPAHSSGGIEVQQRTLQILRLFSHSTVNSVRTGIAFCAVSFLALRSPHTRRRRRIVMAGSNRGDLKPRRQRPNGSASDGDCGVNSSAPSSVICMSSSSRTPNSPRM